MTSLTTRKGKRIVPDFCNIFNGSYLTLHLNISWKPILENIETRFDAYLEQENRVNRRKMVDNRVHACIYFIAPTGHS